MSPFYNAHHAPLGAFATLTLGQKGRQGGLGLGLSGPANQNFFIGLESAFEPGQVDLLPFCDLRAPDVTAYEAEIASQAPRPKLHLRAVPDTAISRQLTPTIDEWTAGDLTLRIHSPYRPLHEDNAPIPALWIELVVDNMLGSRPRIWSFGHSGDHPERSLRPFRDLGLVGIQHGLNTLIATDDPEAWACVHFDPAEALLPGLMENAHSFLGDNGMIGGRVMPQEVKRIRFVVAFHQGGQITTGIPTRFRYTRFWPNLESVAEDAMTHFEDVVAQNRNEPNPLSEDQAWMRAMAIRSYLGNTQLLETEDGDPLWVVNEGEYRMMNTLDLTVDQCFHELAHHPWTVRNNLELFARRYSYWDDVQVGETTASGGLAFCHDMGVNNQFAPEAHSSYERAGLTGCFSYMSYEELLNWLLCAWMYGDRDRTWWGHYRDTIRNGLYSLLNRDHEEEAERVGTIQRDGARCRGGAEITTYDSLDESLGQTRGNAYIAGKTFATCLGLREMLNALGETDLAAEADRQAERAANLLLASRRPDGVIPALLLEEAESVIIPVIEGLAYPLYMGLRDELEGRFGELTAALSVHFKQVLQPGVCLFADGGWKLSSTRDNSWLSKIYLCQWVARELWGHEDPTADAAHVQWLLNSGYWAWSDQMVAGVAQGSRYYPRGVTSELWLSRRR